MANRRARKLATRGGQRAFDAFCDHAKFGDAQAASLKDRNPVLISDHFNTILKRIAIDLEQENSPNAVTSLNSGRFGRLGLNTIWKDTGMTQKQR